MPTLDDHFKPLSLFHLSVLRMAMLVYILTLPSPPCKLRRHSLNLSFFCFFVKNTCIKKPCPSNAICQAGFSSEGYRCVCVPGYTGEDCTEGEADICVQYLSVSSHLTIRKVGDRLFYFKSLVLSSCIYFLFKDKEVSAVNWEKNLRKRQGMGAGVGGRLATGGKTCIKKKIDSLPLSALETSMSPYCNAIRQ